MTSTKYSELPASIQPPADLRSKGYKVNFFFLEFKPMLTLSSQNGCRPAVEYVETMRTLPAGLKPRKGIHYTPPKFVYGWLMSDGDILDIIEQHHPQLVAIGNYDDEDYVDIYLTLAKVRSHFINDLKIEPRWRPDTVGVVDVTKSCYGALAITDSYENGEAVPPQEVMQKIKEFFHLEEEPRWFLDLIHDRWRRRFIFKRRTGELEATTDF